MKSVTLTDLTASEKKDLLSRGAGRYNFSYFFLFLVH